MRAGISSNARSKYPLAFQWLKTDLLYAGLLFVVFLGFFRFGTVQVPAIRHDLPSHVTEEPVHAHFVLNNSVSSVDYLRSAATADAPSSRRAKIRLYIGVFSAAKGIDSKYGKRRKAIRDTWLPAAKSLKDTVVRFVVGVEHNPVILEKLQREMAQFKDEFLSLDVEDCGSCLAEKAAAFLLAVDAAYDAEWILKVHDDVYLAPHRLPPVAAQWDRIGADHTGCFRHGAVAAPRGRPPAADAEATAFLLSARYPLHVYSALYAVRGRTVRHLLQPNAPALRRFRTDGLTLGMWLLAFNVTFFEDTRLCEATCRPAAVAFQQLSCNGLCSIGEMTKMHGNPGCTGPLGNVTSPRYLPSQSAAGAFDAMQVP